MASAVSASPTAFEGVGIIEHLTPETFPRVFSDTGAIKQAVDALSLGQNKEVCMIILLRALAWV